MAEQQTDRPTWSSRLVFLLATIGAAVGLGNIWKFPYMAGDYGGSAFVLVYVVAIALVAIPLVMTELMIGRRGRGSPVHAIERLAVESGAKRGWRWIGWLNVLTVFVILSFYSVIAGWALAYIPKLASGRFAGMDAEGVVGEFAALKASPMEMAVWHGLFIVLTVVIVARGLEKGIEKAVGLLMPALFAMLVVLIGYGIVAGDMGGAVEFLLAPDFSKITPAVALSAVGQAFFSASVAMGLTITYGSYMRRDDSVYTSSVIIIVADTLVAILAGLAIFPVVFENGLDPNAGPGLIFETLPIAFAGMPAGALFGTLFFVLLVFAALTSSIAIVETVVSPFIERVSARRGVVAALVGLAAWAGGLATVLSFNLWEGVRPLGFVGKYAEMGVFGTLDFLTNNVMLPLGGILIAVFGGWVIRKRMSLEELRFSDGGLYRVWRVLVCVVVPALLAAVLVAGI